jgi:hypothetical protein
LKNGYLIQANLDLSSVVQFEIRFDDIMFESVVLHWAAANPAGLPPSAIRSVYYRASGSFLQTLNPGNTSMWQWQERLQRQ